VVYFHAQSQKRDIGLFHLKDYHQEMGETINRGATKTQNWAILTENATEPPKEIFKTQHCF
jgi:hypothetical protein